MEFDVESAIIAGLVATAVVTVLMYLGKALGTGMDLPRLFGLMFAENSVVVYLLGFLVHFGLGALLGLLYGWIFLNVPSSWPWGGIIGAVHGMIAGIVMSAMPTIHPRMGEDDPIPPPGLFGSNYGRMVPVGFVLLHIVFGLVVAWMYMPAPAA